MRVPHWFLTPSASKPCISYLQAQAFFVPPSVSSNLSLFSWIPGLRDTGLLQGWLAGSGAFQASRGRTGHGEIKQQYRVVTGKLYSMHHAPRNIIFPRLFLVSDKQRSPSKAAISTALARGEHADSFQKHQVLSKTHPNTMLSTKSRPLTGSDSSCLPASCLVLIQINSN